MSEEKQEKHIELFPGSISDLERMTGKEYEAIEARHWSDRPLNRPAKIETWGRFEGGGKYIVHGQGLDGARDALIRQARQIGADAIVHTVYITQVDTGTSNISAFGYAVKEVKK